MNICFTTSLQSYNFQKLLIGNAYHIWDFHFISNLNECFFAAAQFAVLLPLQRWEYVLKLSLMEIEFTKVFAKIGGNNWKGVKIGKTNFKNGFCWNIYGKESDKPAWWLRQPRWSKDCTLMIKCLPVLIWPSIMLNQIRAGR